MPEIVQKDLHVRANDIMRLFEQREFGVRQPRQFLQSQSREIIGRHLDRSGGSDLGVLRRNDNGGDCIILPHNAGPIGPQQPPQRLEIPQGRNHPRVDRQLPPPGVSRP